MTKLGNYPPSLYDGILSSAQSETNFSLSSILIELLIQMNITPEKVIIVGDNLDELLLNQSNYQTYNNQSEFIGYLYKAPQQKDYGSMSASEFNNFFTELVNKVNKTTLIRKINKKYYQNPYEQDL